MLSPSMICCCCRGPRRCCPAKRTFHPPDPAHLPQHSPHQFRHGHGDRGGHGHLPGPPGRHRHPAPQPDHRGPGPGSGKGQKVGVRDDHRPGDHRARGPDRRCAATDGALPHLRHPGGGGEEIGGHRHQPGPALRNQPGAEGQGSDDQGPAGHRPGGDHPGGVQGPAP